jgi:Fusaric acid resistance protein-like
MGDERAVGGMSVWRPGEGVGSMGRVNYRPGVLVRWLTSWADRFVASDYGLVRFRFGLRVVLAVGLAALTQAAMRVPIAALLIGCVTAMMCSSSLRAGTTGQRAVNIALFAPAVAASLSLASLLTPYRLVGDGVFVAVMFLAVYLRRFDQLGNSIGLGIFNAYFFATFLRVAPGTLPQMYPSVLVGAASCAVMTLLVFRDPPTSTVRRAMASIRAQVARLIDELADLLESGDLPEDGDALPEGVARLTKRMHETTLQIEDSADVLGLDPRWQRQLVDAELSADRLARATVRALAADLDAATRAVLAEDLRGLRRFVARNPEAVLALDTEELLNRIARYDIRGDPARSPSSPEHHALLEHRAVRELLLSVVQIRRTTLRILNGPDAAERRDGSAEPAEKGRAEERRAEEGWGTDGQRDGSGRAEDVRAEEGWGTDGSGRAEDMRAEPADQEERTGARGRWELPQYVRAAIQASIGGALAITGGELLSAQRWYWAVIAGFLVFAGTNSRGDLLVKGWRRVWGTLLGILAGTVLATLLSGHLPLTVAVLLLCIFFAFYTQRVSYSAMTLFITVMVGMLYDLLGTFSPGVLVLRLEETAIGVAGSVVAAMLVLPTRTRSTVLTALHGYFAALNQELRDAERLLVEADQVSVIADTREVDRAAEGVRNAIAPMLHRLSPSRVRRGHASRLLTLTEESALAARNLARAAEPGSLARLPQAVDTLERLIANTEALLAATEDPPKNADLVSGPALTPIVDVRALARANSTGKPDRVRVLHLRRTLVWLDKLDKALLGMAAPLAQTVTVPRGRHDDPDRADQRVSASGPRHPTSRSA